MNVKESDFKKMFETYMKITVIGMSPDNTKPSHRIPLYMKAHGYDVVAVNPGHKEIAGIKVYNSLAEVPPEHRKFVDVFRRNDIIPDVVNEVLRVGGVEVLWLQLGIFHDEAEHKAEAYGIKVVSDRCLLVEHRKHF